MPNFILAIWAVLLSAFVLLAQTPKPTETAKKPQHQRVLVDLDAILANDLTKQIDQLNKANKRAEAIKLAEELVDLRVRKQGEDHWQVRDAQNTLAFLKRLALTPEQQKELAQVKILDDQVNQLFRARKFQEAIPIAEKSLAIRTEILGSKHPDTAQVVNNLASLYDKLAKHKQAEPLYRECLKIRREILGDVHPSTASSLNNLAVLCYVQGKYAEAETYLEESLKTNREIFGNKHFETINCLNNLAAIYQDTGKYTAAEPLSQEVLRAFEELYGRKNRNTGTALNNLGYLYLVQAKYPEAETLLRDALQVRKELLDPRHPDVHMTLNNLGALYNKLGRITEAEVVYRECVKLKSESLGPNHPETASSLNNLAVLYQTQGRFLEAEQLFRESLRILIEVFQEKHPMVASTQKNLGDLYFLQGKDADAETLLLASFKTRKELLGINHPNTAAGVRDLGKLYQKKGLYPQAEMCYLDALDIYKRVYGNNHPEVANVLNNLGALRYYQKKYEEAEEYLQESLKIEKILHKGSHHNIAIRLEHLASIYKAQRKYKEAEEMFRASLKIRQEILGNFHPDTASSLISLGILFQAQRKYDQATLEYLACLRPYEASRMIRAKNLERSIEVAELNPYPLLASTHAALGKPVEAFVAMEHDLARGLLDEQAIRRADVPDSPEQKKRKEIQGRINVIEPRIAKLVTLSNRTATEQKDLDSLIVERRKLDEDLVLVAVAISEAEVADWKTIQKAIPKDSAYVAWIDVNDVGGVMQEHWACVLRSTGEPRWERLPGSGPKGEWTSQDDELPSQVYHALNAPRANLPEIQTLVAKFRTQRFTPIMKHLEGVQSLYVTAVNDIAGVPLEVLVPELIIGYVPSGTFLTKTKKVDDRQASLFAVGDAIYNVAQRNLGTNQLALRNKNWMDLPATRGEVTRIADLFGKSATTLFDGQASEQVIDEYRQKGNLSQYRYLHFATHGIGNSVRAFESSLVLSQDALPKNVLAKPDSPLIDGNLTASEVLEYWRINADLVTLSACETGVGKLSGGDGLLGFAQAFLVAGSRSVCLSLWKVDDTATALLMTRFYQNLLGKRDGLAKPMKKAAALKEAKDWLKNLSTEEAKKMGAEITKGINRGERGPIKVTIDPTPIEPKVPSKTDKPYAHPRFWAAFILIGEPE